MPPAPSYPNDQARDARKYERLVIELRHMTTIIHGAERSQTIVIARILEELLPHLVKALEAEQGFIARRAVRSAATAPFAVTFAIPQALGVTELPASPMLQALVAQGGARIVAVDADQAAGDELTGMCAQSAILAVLHTLDHVYLVGLCDKQDAELYPFLAADLRVLENLLALLAVGLRTVERQQRESQIIQEISQRVAEGSAAQSRNGESVWQLIARQAAELTNAQYGVIYACEPAQQLLIPRCAWQTMTQQCVGDGKPLPLDAPSLNGYVARQRQAYYLDDVWQSTPVEFLPTEIEQEVQAAYCTPLISQTELVGTLYVASLTRDGIAPDRREALDRLAPHAAIALHNALLLERQAEALAVDEDVIRLHQEIADLLDEERQADQLRAVLIQFFPPQADFFLALYDAASDEISLPIVYAWGEQIPDPANHPLYRARWHGERRGFLDFMLANDRAFLAVDDVDAWESAQAIALEYRAGVGCCLIARLTYAGVTRGWIGFRGFGQARLFNARHKQLMEKMAPHIAIVLHNTHQYTQRLKELGVVSNFQTDISALSRTEEEEIRDIAVKAHIALRDLGLYTGEMYVALLDLPAGLIRVPLAYEGGDEPLSDVTCARIPAYCTRPLGERNDLIEWILANDEPVLAHTHEELERWRACGVTELSTSARSWLGLPMRGQKQMVGVLVLRSATEEYRFNRAHVPLLRTIADQAAITIENARHYQQAHEEVLRQNSLYRAGRAIAAAGLERDVVLRTILEQATTVTHSHLGTIYLLEEGRLKLVAAWPPERFDALNHFFAEIPAGQPSIMWRAMAENEAQLVPDVSKDADFLDYNEGQTQAELAVVLRAGFTGRRAPIGVLNVEHRELGGLDTNDRRVLINLSNLAVVAIQNARQAEALGRMRAIAVMGAWGAEVIHDVKQEVGNIRWSVDALRARDDLDAAVRTELDSIDTAAARMRVPNLPTRAQALTAVGELTETPVLDARDRRRGARFRAPDAHPYGLRIWLPWADGAHPGRMAAPADSPLPAQCPETPAGGRAAPHHRAHVRRWGARARHGDRQRPGRAPGDPAAPLSNWKSITLINRRGAGCCWCGSSVKRTRGRPGWSGRKLAKGARFAFTVPRVVEKK